MTSGDLCPYCGNLIAYCYCDFEYNLSNWANWVSQVYGDPC